MAPSVYLVDLHCYKPPEELRMVMEEVEDAWVKQAELKDGAAKDGAANAWDQESVMEFSKRVFEKSGLSRNGTYLPKNIHPKYCGTKPEASIDLAYAECKMAICGAVEGLLQKTGLAPKDVDIIITTCSLFCPTPSMASMVVNHFKMRSSVKSYHLGGMGCSNGVVAIDLVKDLLQVHPNANLLFITNETCTTGMYQGFDKSRIVTNIIFRMGAAAMLFTGNPSGRWKHQLKYRLQHNIRVCAAAIDEAYKCIWFGPDSKGNTGVYLGFDVAQQAGRAVKKAIVSIAPKIMTLRQYWEFAVTELRRRVLGDKDLKPYTPTFSECVSHFCIHAGGAKVLDTLGDGLRLRPQHLVPSRAVLHDYGNVSSSTTWYTLAFIESCYGVKQGQKIFQVGVGSGVKCGINIWQAVRSFQEIHEAWAHREEAVPRVPVPKRLMPMLLLQLGVLLVFVALVVALVSGTGLQ